MSDTPRTDKVESDVGMADDAPIKYVPSSFARQLEREAGVLREALQWIMKISDKNYEQDKDLRANGARTLIRISDRAKEALSQTAAGRVD